MNKVHVWSEFVVPIEDVQVIGIEERPRNVQVPREKCEQECDGNAEPEDRGFKQEMIVAIDRRGNPSGGDD
jgi:hypothetical protein